MPAHREYNYRSLCPQTTLATAVMATLCSLTQQRICSVYYFVLFIVSVAFTHSLKLF